MGLVGETDPWGWYKSMLAAGGDIFGVGIGVEVAEEVNGKEIAESWSAVYCGNFSIIFCISLILVMSTNISVKEVSLQIF